MVKLAVGTRLRSHLKFNAQLKINFSVLQMPLSDLKKAIEREVESNPLLELRAQEKSRLLSRDASLYPRSIPGAAYDLGQLVYPETLSSHLQRQLSAVLDNEKDLLIAEKIIGNINSDGFLDVTTAELAKQCGASAKEIKVLLGQIRRLEPTGIASRNLRECLLGQARAKKIKEPLVYRLIRHHLDRIRLGSTSALATKLQVSHDQLQKALEIIKGLDHSPGRSIIVERVSAKPPDLIFFERAGEFSVRMNDAFEPRIRLNQDLQPGFISSAQAQSSRAYFQNQLMSARSFLAALRQRRRTLLNIGRVILDKQPAYFRHGAVRLTPLTLSQVAKVIGHDVSTVSRAISGKCAETPWGVVDLHDFFCTGIKQKTGRRLSSRSIQAALISIWRGERQAISDAEVELLLKKKGITVSRRTICKYRTRMKIPSSYSR